MKQHKYRLLLFGIGLALLTALACSGTAVQSSSGGSQAMEKKDGAMMDKGGTSTMEKKDDAMMDKKLPDLIRAAHFVDSSPKHGDTIALVPEKITINFDFTLHEISSIKVTKD